MRTCGGVFVVMWRSDPPSSTVTFNKSGSVAIGALSAVPGPQTRLVGLLHRFPYDFLDGGHPLLDLPQPTRA